MGTQAKNDTKTAHVMNLIGRGTADRVLPVQQPENQTVKEAGAQPPALAVEVDEKRLDELAANIRAAEAQNQRLAQMMLCNAIDIGRWLTEAKAVVRHGEWGEWLRTKVEYSQSKANYLMRLYRKYGCDQENLFLGSNSQSVANLSVTQALLLLNVPEDELSKFIAEPHLVNGKEKLVADMTRREIEAVIKERDAVIKERDAALKAAEEAKAEQSAAELTREKMEQDMAIAKRLLEAAQAERDRAFQDAQHRKEALAESTRNVARLEKELEELRSRPVDVAVEADAAAIEAARKEGEAAMQAKLDKAKKAKAKAEEARKAAEEAKAAAQQELEKAKAEVRSIREQAAKAEKKSEAISNEDFMMLRAILPQMGAQLNQVAGLLMKLQRESPKLLPAALAAVADFNKTAQKVIESYQGVTVQ